MARTSLFRAARPTQLCLQRVSGRCDGLGFVSGLPPTLFERRSGTPAVVDCTDDERLESKPVVFGAVQVQGV